jgi:hypothetical protein
MGKQDKSHLNNVTMLAIGSTILLMSVRARDMMRDANGSKEGVEFLIFASPIGLNGYDLAIKYLFNKLLKLKKIFGHLRLMMK